MKQDLKDVTFNIPVKIDSKARARNLFIVCNYIDRLFDTNIIICEQGQQYVQKILNNICYRYIYIEDNDNIIHRTHQLNIMAKESTTPIIVNYDCDVILSPQQYIDAANMIRCDQQDMVYPYDGRFLEISEESAMEFANHYNINNIDINVLPHVGAPNKPSVGGAIFHRKSTFIEFGMENENFCGWGFEDDERFYRFSVLGARISRIEKPLIHLCHPKNLYHSTHSNNICEYNRIKLLNKDALIKDIKTWKR